MRLKNKKILVIGLGKSGQAVVEFLCEKGALVSVYDDNKEKTKDVELLYNVMSICDFEEIKKMDLAIVSPGVSKYHEVVKQCVLQNVYVMGELEFATNFVNGKILALTGSNGKTTTVSLIKHIFDTAKKKSVLAGNIGTPLIKFNSIVKRTYILEVSSFQLETSNFRPYISGITNISSNHLDRHFSINEYFETKKNIFKSQTKDDFLVLNADDEKLSNIDKSVIRPKIVWFSCEKEVDGAFIKDDYFCFKKGRKIEKICKIDNLHLIGKHNLSNCLCAICFAMISRIKIKYIKNAIETFKAVEHRIEFVREIKGIEFINDSKSTTPKSTEMCVNSIVKPIILILGGSDKGIDYHDMVHRISNRIKLAILTGEIAEKLKQAFDDNLKINYVVEKDFIKAISLAYEKAEKGDSVVLSPATASFDIFKNFEERGKVFKDFVKGLDEK